MVLLCATACTTKRNPDVCCISNADCERLGGIPPTGCPDGFVCRNLLCEEATCTSSSDCPLEQPSCNTMTASCTACTSSADCARFLDTPVCDTTSGGCRTCRLDTECASEVCDVDTGRCVEEAKVIYASPTGPDTAACTHERPCSTARAIIVANLEPSAIVRMLPGLYTSQIIISTGTMTIVGTGAVLRVPLEDQSPFEVRGNANVRVYRLEIDTVNATSLGLAGVRCEGIGSMYPTLFLRDSTIHVFTVAKHSTVETERSHLGYGLYIQDDATAKIDRTLFRRTREINGAVSISTARYNLRITNSVLDDVPLYLNTVATTSNDYHLYFGFNTFVAGLPLRCPSSNDQNLAVFENSIFVATQGSQSILLDPGNKCAFINSLAFPQDEDLGATNIYADPKFVDIANRDFRLKQGSPAIDRASSIASPDFNHDFQGVARPQGEAGDLGAYEFTP